MDWIQVGLVYSIMGWLRNKVNYKADLPSEEEIAKRIEWLS